MRLKVFDYLITKNCFIFQNGNCEKNIKENLYKQENYV